jgi:hypothetical protein
MLGLADASFLNLVVQNYLVPKSRTYQGLQGMRKIRYNPLIYFFGYWGSNQPTWNLYNYKGGFFGFLCFL